MTAIRLLVIEHIQKRLQNKVIPTSPSLIEFLAAPGWSTLSFSVTPEQLAGVLTLLYFADLYM